MPSLSELVSQHLERTNIAVKTLADRTGIGYPTLLNLMKRGGLPRKAEHRERLRQELGLDGAAWAGVLAASDRHGGEIPESGPLTLQQLVRRELYAKGLTEQRFAEISGIAYPTLLGITRRGAVPRTDTIRILAEKLGLTEDEIGVAAELSRNTRRETRDRGDPLASDEQSAADDAIGSTAAVPLSQLASERIAIAGVSTAAFAREHGIPYLVLSQILQDGQPPEDPAQREALRQALNLDAAGFTRSVTAKVSAPAPVPHADPDAAPAANPLHAALLAVVRERHLTARAFAQLAGLSALTAAKLIKRGELPGRTRTHSKLRALLGLSEEAYQALIVRSQPAGAPVPAVEAADGEEVPTDQIVPSGDGDALEQVAGASGDRELRKLLRSVAKLPPAKRRAVERLVQTLGG